jgi:hypothetical protein
VHVKHTIITYSASSHGTHAQDQAPLTNIPNSGLNPLAFRVIFVFVSTFGNNSTLPYSNIYNY